MTEATMGTVELVDINPIRDTIDSLKASGWFGKNEEISDLAACLSALLTSLHFHGDVRHICEALPYTPNRTTSLSDFLNTMANLGYASHSMPIKMNAIDKRLTPCLFIPKKHDGKERHALVVLGFSNEPTNPGVSIYYGGQQKTMVIPFDSAAKGTAYFFEKINLEEIELEKKNQDASGHSWFRSLFSRFKDLFTQIFFTSIMINVLALAMPLFVMTVYDKVIGAHSEDTLYYLLFGVVLALVTEGGLRFVRSKSICWLGARLDNIVSNTIFERLLFLPAVYTEGASISAQVARIKAFESVRDFFTSPLFLVLVELPFVVVLLAAIYFIAGSLVYVPIVVACAYIAMLLILKPRLKVAIRSAAKAGSAKQQLSMETFSKMHALRYNGISGSWFEKYRELSGKSSLASFESSFIASIIETIAHALSIIAGVATIAFGVELIWAGQMTIGALVATMIIVWRVLAPLQTLCTMLPRVEQVYNSVEQVNRLVNLDLEKSPHSLQKSVDELQGNIKFSNVGLRYNRDLDPVFAGLNLDIKQGELVAITGGNGSGKSTILKLVNGLYRPQAGNIRIDGIDIRQMDPIELRRYIAYVAQSPDFFEGTIAENLRFADPVASESILQNALKQVNAWDDVASLSDGLQTKIGGKYMRLPTSLAYRINLARAFIKSSNIMLFDELPYALLNSESGESYSKIIESSRGVRTVLFVTHRDDYIKMADKVVVLKSGQKPKICSPEEVLNTYDDF